MGKVTLTREFGELQSHSSLHLQAIDLMAYQTGMRTSEILKLTRNRIDLKGRLVRLKAEDTNKDDIRQVPLTTDLTTLLRRPV